jgi:hypothetical protein
MRNAELVVKYLRGPEPVTGRIGYAGVFRCSLDVDEAFRRAEPPTHDDWIPRALPPGHDRTFVKVALERILRICREAAGYDSAAQSIDGDGAVPLGEFADALAGLLPSLNGPGARRPPESGSRPRKRRRNAPGRSVAAELATGAWIDGSPTDATPAPTDAPAPWQAATNASSGEDQGQPDERMRRRPQVRNGDEPHPALAEDGTPVIVYSFELRGHGNPVRLAARVEVMTNDGAQVETEAPRGQQAPSVRAWRDPSGVRRVGSAISVEAGLTDGRWEAEVPLVDEAMMRVDVIAEAG